MRCTSACTRPCAATSARAAARPSMHRRRAEVRALTALAAGVAACAGAPPTSATGASCPTDRIVTLGTQDEVDRFAGCTSASGLVIRTGAPLRLAPLRQLESITGDLVVGPTVGLEELSLAELRTVGG